MKIFKNILIITLFIIPVINCYCQVLSINDTSLVIFENWSNSYRINFKMLEDGEYKLMNDSNLIIQSFKVKNHKPVEWYYTNSNDNLIMNYLSESNTTSIYFFDSTAIKDIYIKNNAMSYSVEYYKNQKVKKTYLYYPNTKESHEYFFYENGTLEVYKRKIDNNYIAGDTIIYYNPNSTIKEIQAFEDSYNCGVIAYENNMIYEKGFYIITESEIESGVFGYGLFKNKTWQYFNEDGKLIKEEFYENGNLIRSEEY